MQRAILAGIILGVLLAYLGIFVNLRRMAFFSDGMAHASLAGVAIGILMGYNPLIVALLLAIIFAVLIYFFEEKLKISSDASIGILFTSGMAFGVLLMSLRASYQPELVSFLFGNILAINNAELWLIAALAIFVLVFLMTQRAKLTLISLNNELARTAGINPNIYQLLLYVFLAVSVVLGIKILGVVLVSALLIIPVSIAKLFAKSFKSLLGSSLVLSEIVILSGIILSFWFNLPTGAVIVLVGAILFIFTLLLKVVLRIK